MGTQRLSGLDGIRGLAALAIVLHHVWWYDRAGIASPSLGLGVVDDAFGHLRLGVTVFFVLSGFLLYRPFARAILDGEPAPALGRYFTGRVLRIVPAYWVAVALLVALFHRDVLSADPGAVARTFLFAQIYAETPTIIGPAWSLCVEVAFYAVLPALAAGIGVWARRGGRARRQFYVLLGLVGLAFAYRLLARHGAVPPIALPGYIDQFAVGMLLAVVYERRPRRLRPREAGALAVGALAAAVLATLACQDDPSHTSVVNGFGLVYETVIAGSVGVALAALVLSPAAPMLGGRALTALGVISYGIFLWHAPLLNASRDAGILLPNEARFYAANLALVLVPTVIVAVVSWRLVERPMLALKGRAPAPHAVLPEPTA